MKRGLGWTTSIVLFVVLLAGAVRLQNEMIYLRRLEPYRFRDTLYLPDSRYVRAVSMGYHHFLADFLWLRMIQTFAGGWSLPESPHQMKHYFDIITDLDPKFRDVYSFAMLAIGEGTAPVDPQIRVNYILEVVDKALLNTYGEYHIPFEGAFFAFWTLDDPELAKYYVRIAKKDPNYPVHMEHWEAYFDLQQGQYLAAFEKFFKEYAQVLTGDNPTLIDIRKFQLRRAVTKWFEFEIRQRAEAWKQTHGRWPSIEELEQAGAFSGVVLPNWNAVQAALSGLASGAVLPPDQADLQLFVEKTIQQWPSGSLPTAPYDELGEPYRGFVIWTALPDDHKMDKENRVMSRLRAMHLLKQILIDLRVALQQYKDRHENNLPPDFETFAPDYAKIPDPFGGRWTWDRATGTFSNTLFPNLEELELPPER